MQSKSRGSSPCFVLIRCVLLGSISLEHRHLIAVKSGRCSTIHVHKQEEGSQLKLNPRCHQVGWSSKWDTILSLLFLVLLYTHRENCNLRVTANVQGCPTAWESWGTAGAAAGLGRCSRSSSEQCGHQTGAAPHVGSWWGCWLCLQVSVCVFVEISCLCPKMGVCQILNKCRQCYAGTCYSRGNRNIDLNKLKRW